MDRINIIDADSIVYLVAYQAKDEEDVEFVNTSIDIFISTILDNTNADKYIGFIGGSRCFRYDLTDDYKASRKESPDWLKKWKKPIRDRLINTWKFVVCDNIEAEDACVIAANKYENVIISHIDKDLNFWEGDHYNYSKHESYSVDKLGYLELNKSNLKGCGLRWQYSQLICGDSTDGIKGLKGKGGSFAYKLLSDANSEYSLFRRTYTAYLEYCKEDDIKEYFKLQWALIVMLKEEAHGFVVPKAIDYKVSETIDDILNI
jgi:5'-3' exonuclease